MFLLLVLALFSSSALAQSCYDFNNVTKPSNTSLISRLQTDENLTKPYDFTTEILSSDYPKAYELDGIYFVNTVFQSFGSSNRDYAPILFVMKIDDDINTIGTLTFDITSYYTSTGQNNSINLYIYNLAEDAWEFRQGNISNENTFGNFTDEFTPSVVTDYVSTNGTVFYIMINRDSRDVGALAIYVDYVKLCVSPLTLGSTTTTTTPSPSGEEKSSDPNLTPVWIILGVAGGALVFGCIIMAVFSKRG